MAHAQKTFSPRRLALVASLSVALGLACQALQAQEPPEPPTPPSQAAVPGAPEAPEVTVEFHEESQAEAAERHAEALAAAEAEQRAALEAVEIARRELQERAEEERRRAMEARERSRERQEVAREDRARQSELRAEMRALEAAEREKLREVQRELERAHANLRRASREVAEVHRDLNRSRVVARQAPGFGANPAVIGVILGGNTDEGVQVLGISPDGPAERAGLEQGDVIVSMMGEPLVVAGGDGRVVIGEVMESVEPGDELVLLVDREGERVEFTVTAEERTPFSWHSVTRLGAPAPPTPPGAPGEPSVPAPPVFVFPEMDEDQLNEELEVLRGQLEQRRIIVDRRGQGGDVSYEFDILSDVGDTAVTGTRIWFGMPLTRGLKFAELDPGLGAYFDAEDGVLVLEAREENLLQLQSGDVIISVDGELVSRPADVMRALRRIDAGETVELEIMRQRAAQTLTVDIPENQFGLHFDGVDEAFSSLLMATGGALPFDGQFNGHFDSQLNGPFDGWVDGLADGLFNGQFDGQFDGQFGGQFDGQLDGLFDGQSYGPSDGQSYGQSDGQPYGPSDGSVAPERHEKD